MKVDVLALGMLTAIRKGFEHDRAAATGPGSTSPACRASGSPVYACCARRIRWASSRSRAGPRWPCCRGCGRCCFYDLVVEVAIVRPGPIQGDMVHPYLKNREAERRARRGGTALPHRLSPSAPGASGRRTSWSGSSARPWACRCSRSRPCASPWSAAEFSGDEANGLRRAMATFRHMGTIHTYEEKMVGRMIARGYDPEFANNCFNQIKGFGEYGFPESHAASFAHLVYVSAWLKRVFPEVFAACPAEQPADGLLRPGPDRPRRARARRRGAPPDVNDSDWDCTLRATPKRTPARAAAGPAPDRRLPRGLGRRDRPGTERRRAFRLGRRPAHPRRPARRRARPAGLGRRAGHARA